jgi:hypothetical protein
MAARRVVVDGSNIATEGRTLPSLRQLNEAVLAFLHEFPDTEVTVVVDATFGHRIDPDEVAEFEDAEANNELVSPPAGAIGRGDAFLLRIAGKIGATVLSNDSFQEFHGDHEWLFDDGRLIGGKPVQGIGWIFTPRTPVRGIKSRKAVKEAKRTKGATLTAGPTVSGEQLGPKPVPKAPPPRKKGEADRVAEAIATATEESVRGEAGNRKRRRKKRGGRPAEPVNEALPFITFIAEHPLGSTVDGEVETFTSHGAFVMAGGARCYVPISALGDPPPRAARDVLSRGESRGFVVQALDPQRRGIELALPEFAKVAGTPQPETIEAEITEAPAEPLRRPAPSARLTAPPVPDVEVAGAGVASVGAASVGAARRGRPAQPVDAGRTGRRTPPRKADGRKAGAPVGGVVSEGRGRATEAVSFPAAAAAEPVATGAPVAAAPVKAAAVKKAPQKAPAKKAAAERVVTEKVAAEKVAADRAPTRKASAKKAAPPVRAPADVASAALAAPAAPSAAAAPSGPAAPAAPAKRAPAKKVAATAAPAKRAPAKKSPVAKAPAKKAAEVAGAKKAPAKKAAGPAKKAVGPSAAPAKKASVKKAAAPAKKAAAKKAPPTREG